MHRVYVSIVITIVINWFSIQNLLAITILCQSLTCIFVVSLCYPVIITDFYDRAYFFNTIANTFARIVQYAQDDDIPDLCNELKTNPQVGDDYTRLSGFVKRRRDQCIGNFYNYVAYYANPNVTGDGKYITLQFSYQYYYQLLLF